MRKLTLLAALTGLLGGCQSMPVVPPPSGGGSAPVLDFISEKTIQERGFPVVIPEFHFHDADGDVIFIARDLIASDGPHQQAQGAAINEPADLQKRGAIFAGRWDCGPNVYTAHMQAYLIDRAGNRSNVVPYTIRCNG